jgi:hypothetical protein
MSNPFGWYLILAWPIFALWMGRMFTRIVWGGAAVVLLILLGAYVADLAIWGWKASQDAPLAARINELRRVIPANAPVLANGALWFAFWDRDYTDQYYLTFRQLEVAHNPGLGPTGWDAEQKNQGWRYIAAYGDLRRFLDPEIPLTSVLTSDALGRGEQIRQARAFSLAHCSVERRIPGYGDSILVMRIQDAIAN